MDAVIQSGPGNREFDFVAVGDVPFAVASLDDAVTWVEEATTSKLPVSVRLANAYCVSLASDDLEYRDVMVAQGVNFPDGTPVAWMMARRLGVRGWRGLLVRGPSLFERVLENGATRGYFVGATDQVLGSIQRKLESRGLAKSFEGGYAPPYGEVSHDLVNDIARRINQSDADIVWVGMGTPKQDYISTLLAPLVQRPCVGVGAAFDFYSGAVREAPKVLHGSGLEWLYRLGREPGRLIKRYSVGSARFVMAVRRGASE